jgi:cell pole-organizing protein PopZ
VSTQEPMTEAGKALLDDEAPVRREGDVLVARGFEWERRDRLAERIAKVESDARAIGAQQERAELTVERLADALQRGSPNVRLTLKEARVLAANTLALLSARTATTEAADADLRRAIRAALEPGYGDAFDAAVRRVERNVREVLARTATTEAEVHSPDPARGVETDAGRPALPTREAQGGDPTPTGATASISSATTEAEALAARLVEAIESLPMAHGWTLRLAPSWVASPTPDSEITLTMDSGARYESEDGETLIEFLIRLSDEATAALDGAAALAATGGSDAG